MKTTALLALLALTLCARADLTEEQRRVPREVESPDPKLAKIVLIAGSVSNSPGSHEYFAGCALMMDWLKQADPTLDGESNRGSGDGYLGRVVVPLMLKSISDFALVSAG